MIKTISCDKVLSLLIYNFPESINNLLRYIDFVIKTQKMYFDNFDECPIAMSINLRYRVVQQIKAKNQMDVHVDKQLF